MEKNERLSISIPTRNRCSYLQELLQSIKKQVVQQPSLLEFIKIYIFDNDSNDNTAEMIAAFDLPISYKKNEKDIGGADNIFQAYATPSGQYIWVIGDDELLPDHAIEIILGLLEQFQPSLLLTKAAGYESFVQMPPYFNNYQEFSLFAQQHNPHLLLAHTLISVNVVRKECFDAKCARQYKHESYAQMMGIISGLKKYPGKVIETQQQTLIVREERANFNDVSAEDIQQILAKSQLILRDQITYLAWLKQELGLREIVPQRVVADYNLRLSPLTPKVSVVLHFAIQEGRTVDENLEVLNTTIESVLAQDYSNIEMLVTSNCYFWQEYVKFAERVQPYGKAVTYAELFENTDHGFIKEFVKGEFVLLLNAGEYLIDHRHITSAVQLMANNPDIGAVFANYSLLDQPGSISQGEYGLHETDNFPNESWTKISGRWLFLHYEKLWCKPCATIFRRQLFSSEFIKNIQNINKLMFLEMLLKTNIVFNNKVVARCRRDFDNGGGKLAIASCQSGFASIEAAKRNAIRAGYAEHNAQEWHDNMIRKYCYNLVNQAGSDAALLTGLYDVAEQSGVAKLLHGAMMDMVHDAKAMSIPRFLFIKAWGCGIWADIDHVLGQLLLAEMLHRTPFVYWGKESLYYSGDRKNVFEKCFLPVSKCTFDQVIQTENSYYPRKWNSENIYERDMEKYTKPYQEVEILNLFDRVENVIVSEVHVGIEVILKYLRPEHELYGCDSLQVARHLYRKYIAMQPEIQQSVETFYRKNMSGKEIIAVHVRAGDRTESREKLQSNNQLYYTKIAELSRGFLDVAVLLLTDSEYVLQEFKEMYGERLIYTECHRTANHQGVHYDHSVVDKSQIAKETVIEVYLAAQCDYFIGCRSNVSSAIMRLKEWDAAKLHIFMQLPSTVL